MAVALLGYFSTMVAVFTGLMFLLTTILGYAPVDRAHPQPHPRPALAQAEASETTPGQWGPPVIHRDVAAAAAMVVEPPATARQIADNSKRLKIARGQPSKVPAQPRDKPDDMAALGYAQQTAQESAQPPASFSALFNPFGPRRF
jgi:hypothetical protein